MSIKVPSTYPCSIAIDGSALAYRVKRLTLAETEHYQATLEALSADAPKEEHQAFARQSLREYITLAPGALVVEGAAGEPDREVTDAVELLDIYGQRNDLVPAMLASVILEQVLPESAKNAYRSRLGSYVGSARTHLTEGPGARPDSTVIAADPAATTPTATAPISAPPDTNASSGMTDPLSVTPVPSPSSEATSTPSTP